MSSPTPYAPGPEPSGTGLKIPILFGAVIALAAANIYQFVQIDSLKTDMSKMRESILTEVANVRETSTVSTQTAKKRMESLQDELEAARRQQAMAVGQAKADAQKHAEEIAKKLEAEQKRAAAALGSQISEVKEVASAATTKIGEVSNEVGTVKTEVANTKSELDKTISSLKSVQGDMGVQSGLIATNGKELAALKALGERNYFEFKIPKAKQPQRVGDVMVLLKKVDVKKNKYTIELTADDKRTEKKDKNINEPVQFYTSKARQPYELVVNEVGKDLIVGYLATPKVQTSRN